MVIDSSVLIAILSNEPERNSFERTLEAAATRLLSTSNYVETAMVVLSRRGELGLVILSGLLSEMRISIVPLSIEHAKLAIDAFRRFGKGRHPAALNFGDCCAYALAKATGLPLLFKGNDFARTDVTPA